MSALYDHNGKRVDTMGVYDKKLLERLLPKLTFGLFGRAMPRHVTLFGSDNLPIPSGRIAGVAEKVTFTKYPPVQLQDGKSPEWTCPTCGGDLLWCKHPHPDPAEGKS